MKVLVIGNGAREHALVWKISKSNRVEKVYCAPGNGGTGQIACNVDIRVDDLQGLLGFAVDNAIDLTVVGPELPLVLGIVDLFRENGLQIIGPDKKGARLEGSKEYAKEFMVRYGIPTASYLSTKDYNQAATFIEKTSCPIVIKADGLAAGKGVYICSERQEALRHLQDIMITKVHGEAGDTVVIEEFLQGFETSVLCFTDGVNIVPMVSVRDYKRAYDQDQGPNTGGMGCISPNENVNEEMMAVIKEKVLEPFLAGIQNENMDFRGIIYFGLMITNEGPKVLEFNTRFGDPETQVILPRLESDLVDIFEDMLNRKLNPHIIMWSSQHCGTVILCSGGYPDKYEINKNIIINGGLDTDNMFFHGGTKVQDGQLVTNGGRVIAVTSLGQDIKECMAKCYNAIEQVNFRDMTYRKDIGKGS